ncbi:VOC family protein [Halobacillus sp. A5]|uniref:VOC family protein n=1 Tax=Halobacillus sp. A5 TaxID=2880263 RepID=UPI0020A6D4DA|nr:VOC family protein [Halobacillus sp. A5]
MRFSQVLLYTDKLDELFSFYIHKLKFPLHEDSEDHFTIIIGKSQLTFVKSENKHFYHFALNLAVNHFEDAKQTMKPLVDLNVEVGEDEVHFTASNARSFYFHDPAGNIVEFIVRYDYSHTMEKPFSVSNLLDIGEVSLTSRDGGVEVQQLNFMGKDGRYILLGPPGRKWLFSHQAGEQHPVRIEINDGLIIEMDDQGELNVQ